MKILGFRNYFKQIENVIEFIIGSFCVLLYLLYLFTSLSKSTLFEDVEQPIVFIVWCIWQVFRIGYLVFKQAKARDTLDPKISFNRFSDEIDNGSFMGKSAKVSDIESNPSKTPPKNVRKSQPRRKDDDERLSNSFVGN